MAGNGQRLFLFSTKKNFFSTFCHTYLHWQSHTTNIYPFQSSLSIWRQFFGLWFAVVVVGKRNSTLLSIFCGQRKRALLLMNDGLPDRQTDKLVDWPSISIYKHPFNVCQHNDTHTHYYPYILTYIRDYTHAR